MDGTIANTDELVVETMFELYDLYRNGVRSPREKCYYFSGPPIRESLASEFPDQDVEFLAKEFARLSRPKYDTIVTSYPHCREVLLELKKMGIKLGVVTNKFRNMSIHCLEVINLSDVFDVLVGFDDVKEHKPHPEGIFKAMKETGISDLKKVLYIGDNKLDDETGKSAHIDTCLVTWGPRKMSDEVKPTYKIDDYFNLLEVIK